MAKIYLASSWRNEFQPQAVLDLRAAGHEVYDFRNSPHGQGGFAWGQIDPNWKNWTAKQYRMALLHPIAEKGFNSDLTGMMWADVGILLNPCGRSAHLELGYMAGVGKKTIIWTRDGEEPDLMYSLANCICISLEEVLSALWP